MKNYLKLMRLQHAIKNFLIIFPLFFSKELLNKELGILTLFGFLAFTFTASTVYIVNDICDKEKDRFHSTKRYRLIASGAISVKNAGILVACCLAFAALFSYLASRLNPYSCFLPAVYLIVNIGYSLGLKTIPIIDITILVSGFVLRLLYGSLITGIPTSNWLYLTVVTLSFYMSLGKRRNEIRREKSDTRRVLESYNITFLDKSMYMCLGMSIVFYSLWCVDSDTIARVGHNQLIYTVPLIILICLKYSLIIEGNSDGDPVEVIINDRFIRILSLVCAASMFVLIYLGGIRTF